AEALLRISREFGKSLEWLLTGMIEPTFIDDHFEGEGSAPRERFVRVARQPCPFAFLLRIA
ncbi:MAG: hypothetical protein WCA38_06440, partial [Candidatus Acidiferrales bacterium]